MNREWPYILLADDDPDDLAAFTQAFAEANPHACIETVADGQEVIEYLQNCDQHELPSLIVLDYKMPMVSGPEVLQRLAACPAYAGIPKVIWSTSDRRQDIDRCTHLGATGYFLKPASHNELVELIHKIDMIYSTQLQH